MVLAAATSPARSGTSKRYCAISLALPNAHVDMLIAQMEWKARTTQATPVHLSRLILAARCQMSRISPGGLVTGEMCYSALRH